MVSDDSGGSLARAREQPVRASTRQAEARYTQYGENVLREHPGKKTWQVFLEQFQDLLVLILIAAAAISILSGSGESAAVIFAVITMNAVLGTIQHEKARKSLESLKKLSAPAARVLRDGREREIPAAKLVPGDIVLLDAGSLVAADGRLLECHNLQMNESSLTGESLPVEKRSGVLKTEAEPPLGDQSNMAFTGSLVTGGRGVFVVTATGMETELGKIAGLMNSAKEKKTPLQISLDQFSTHLGSADSWNLCAGVRIKSVPGDRCAGSPDVCGGAGCGGYPGSTGLHCDHCPGHGNPADGPGTCHYQGFKGGGKPWLCVGDLFG